MYKVLLNRLFVFIDLRAALTFLTVGGISAAINFGSFAVLWNYFHINYKIAVSVAYVLAVIFHFTANRRYTFKSHGHSLWKHLKKYLVMITINYLLTMLVVHIAVETLSLSPYLGLVMSIGVTVGVGYLLSKFWVFA